MYKKYLCLFTLLLSGSMVFAQRKMEYLDRGLIAMPDRKGHLFVSWRLLGTEDPATTFNVYRNTGGKTVKLNPQPVEASTSFMDSTADLSQEHQYTVKAVLKKKEEKNGAVYTVPANAKPYLSIPLRTPAGYSANDASAGDMDGDGVYEIVIHMTR